MASGSLKTILAPVKEEQHSFSRGDGGGWICDGSLRSTLKWSAVSGLLMFYYYITCLPHPNHTPAPTHTHTHIRYPIKRTVLDTPERLPSPLLPPPLKSPSPLSFYSTKSGVKTLFHQNHINPTRGANIKIHGPSRPADSDSARSSILRLALSNP